MDEEPRYDVFLSHNSADKPAVEELARLLAEEAGLRPFLDKWHLIPGEPWQEALEEALEQSATVAVFVGPSGVSPWRNEEMRTALDNAVRTRNEYRVIPVLLPGASPEAVTGFLARRTWVDFRPGLDDAEAFQRLVAGIKGEAMDIGAYELPDEPAPYRGLLPFKAEHAGFFFGRESDTQCLIEKLGQGTFVAVIGASGSGKSSLVRAGLLPVLAKDVLPDSSQWHTLVLTPGGQPLRALAEGLATFVPPADRLRVSDDLEDRLARQADGLRAAATTMLADTQRPLLLVIDQFEEVFTLCQGGSERCRAQAEQFIANLADTARREDRRILIVITLRADFLDRCLAFHQLKDLLQDRQMLLGPLDEPALRDAIVRPAQAVGAYFEKGLVGTILRDVQAQPGALPLLQHALYELWRARRGPWLTLDAYEASGGVSGALQRRAQATYDALTPEQQQIARNIFLRLTALGEGVSDTRRRVSRSELYPAGVDSQQVDAVLQVLSGPQARLVIADEQSVEVAHEVLIQQWSTLREWLEEDRAGLRIHRRLTEAAIEWEKINRDNSFLYRGVRLAEAEEWTEDHAADLNPLEQEFLEASVWAREIYRFWVRLGIAGLVVAVVVFAGLALFAFQERSKAERIAAEMQSLALAGNAEQALRNRNPDLAMALALQANSLESPPVQATTILAEAVYASQTRRRFTGHSDWVWGVAFDPDGRTALSGSEDKSLVLWDVEKGERIRSFDGHTAAVRSVAFSPGGNTALSGSADKSMILWDVKTGQEIHRFTGHSDWVMSVAFSPDGNTALSGSADKSMILWDLEKREEIYRFIGYTDWVLSVAFSPDGRMALSGSADSNLELWDLHGELKERVRRFVGHTGWVHSVAFSSDCRTVLSGSGDNSLRLWNTGTGEEILRLDGHTGEVQSVAFSPDGRTALSGARDTSLRLWDLESHQEKTSFDQKREILSVAFGHDGHTILSGAADGSLILWDIQSKQKSIFDGYEHTAPISSLAFSPDGMTALSGSHDHSLILWDVATGAKIYRFTGHAAAVLSVAFSPDGRTALSGSADRSLILWDLEKREEKLRLTGHANLVTSVAYSPDGRYALSGSYDHTLILWDLESGQLIHRFAGHTSAVLSVAFSPDGRTALSGSADRSLILWDLEKREEKLRLTGHTNWVTSTAFSPDSHTALSGSADGSLILWILESGKELRRFYGHLDWVWSVAFSPDGHTALSGSADGSLRIWTIQSLDPDELKDWLCAHRHVHELTAEERELYRIQASTKPFCAKK